MRQHVFDGETCNRFVLWNQEQRARLLDDLNHKTLDELRYLVAEFRQASEYVHFNEREWTWLDLARLRLAQLEAIEAAVRLAQLKAAEAA